MVRGIQLERFSLDLDRFRLTIASAFRECSASNSQAVDNSLLGLVVCKMLTKKFSTAIPATAEHYLLRMGLDFGFFLKGTTL